MTRRIRIVGVSMVVGFLGPLACSDDGHLIGERSSSGGSSGSGAQAGTGASGTSGASTGGGSGAATGGTTATGGDGGTATGGGGSSGAGGTTENGGSSSGGSAGEAGGTGGNGGASGAAAGAGGTAGSSGSGTGGVSEANCSTLVCAAGDACVAVRTVGGARILPDDAGACPPNTHLEGDVCAANFGYRCVAQPRCPAGGIQCSCGTCPSGYGACRAAGASQWLDSNADLVCELLAP